MKAREAEEGFSIYHSFEIKAPADKIFDAVSKPEHLIEWWPLKC